MSLDELFALDDGFPTGAEILLTEGALPLDEESRVLAKIRQKTEAALPKKEEERPVKKTRFGLMLLAAALVLGTVMASATGYLQPIAGVLGISAEGWPEFFGGNGAVVSASQECDGWTLTVDRAVGDRSYAYIILDLTAPEGVVLDADGYTLDHTLQFFGSSGGSMLTSMVEDDDKTDNHVSFMIETTVGGFPWGKTGHLEVIGLKEIIKTGPDESEVRDYPAQLYWNMRFSLKFRKHPIVYRPKEPIEMNGGTVKINKVEISSLSARVKFSSKDGGLGRSEMGGPPWMAPEIKLLDKDGNPFPTNGSHGSGNGVEGVIKKAASTITFQPIIDPDRAVALWVDGIVIPLK